MNLWLVLAGALMALGLDLPLWRTIVFILGLCLFVWHATP